MAQQLKTEAFVLRRIELLNKDMLIHLLTKDSGRITVIAKGVKTVTSRRAAHLQTGNYLKIAVNVRSEYHYVQQTELISGFTAVKADAHKMEQLYTFFFVLDRILPEHQPELPIFSLTKGFMKDLSRNDAFGQSQTVSYLNRLLMALGYTHEEKNAIETLRMLEDTIHEKIPFRII